MMPTATALLALIPSVNLLNDLFLIVITHSVRPLPLPSWQPRRLA